MNVFRYIVYICVVIVVFLYFCFGNCVRMFVFAFRVFAFAFVFSVSYVDFSFSIVCMMLLNCIVCGIDVFIIFNCFCLFVNM